MVQICSISGQIADVEAERDADARSDTADQSSPVATLMGAV